MPDINRRGFVGSVAASLPVAAASRRILKPGGPTAAPLDDELTRALGRALLPSELGTAGIERVVGEFQQWLDRYEADAELNHGYGTGEIAYTPADPTPRWQAQLEALNAEAQRRSSVSFIELDTDTQRDIIRQHIADDRIDRLPRAYRARHVAVGLLAYFYSTPEATDLCYQAAIGKNNCRPLRRSPDKPISLERGG